MIKVPITINFQPDNVIGFAMIDETKLPVGMDYVFTIGGRVKELINDRVTEFELLELSLQSDEAYLNYLDHKYYE